MQLQEVALTIGPARMCETAVTKTRGRARERAVCACDVVYTDGPSPPTPDPHPPSPLSGGGPARAAAAGYGIAPDRSLALVCRTGGDRAGAWAHGHRGKVALGARGCAGTGQVATGARVGGGPRARHLQGSRAPMSSRLGLAFDFSRWCRAGTVSVWSSGVWVLLARWPRSRGRRRVAACVPRVTRHGNPQRCCIRRWWGKLRGAGLEKGA